MAARSAIGLAVVVLASVIACGAYVLAPERFVYPDSYYYAEMGRQLARGEGFTSLQAYPFLIAWLERVGSDVTPPWPNVSRFPLITLIYAGPFAVFGAREATVLAIGGVFLVATTLVTYLAGARLFGTAAGALAAVLVTTNVSQIVFAMAALLETPAAFFVTAAALVLVMTLEAEVVPREPRSSWRGFVLGCVLGLAFLLRYDLLALVPAAAAVVWIGHGRRGWRVLCFMALGFALVVGPWVARNLVSFGSPIAFLGIDRNVLWSRVTADPYASSEYVAFWEQLSQHPELLETKIENLSWPIRRWFLLFGWALPWLGPAFLVAGAVLFVLRHRARRAYVFVALAFLGRWLILSATHHEPRFYASFTPVALVFAIGGAWALLERASLRRPVVRWAGFAALAALLLSGTVPRSFPTGGGEAMGEEPPPEQSEPRREPNAPSPEQYALLRSATPPRAVIATTWAEGVAWYGQRPALQIAPDRIAEYQQRGLRVDGLLYGTWAQRHVEFALQLQGLKADFVRVDVGPRATLWLRSRLASKPALLRRRAPAVTPDR